MSRNEYERYITADGVNLCTPEDLSYAPEFESSNIKLFGYSHIHRELWVWFHNGGTYVYMDVEDTAYNNLVNVVNGGNSVGKAFNEIIKKGGYEFEKVKVYTYDDEDDAPEPSLKEGFEVGMLWFDNNAKLTIDERIEKALEYYRNKYHPHPMHPIEVLIPENEMPEDVKPEDEYELGNVIVRGSRWILENHMLIGYRFE